MRKIKFYLGIGFPGAEHEEIFEYDDNATDKEIEEDFKDWQSNYLDAAWWEVEE